MNNNIITQFLIIGIVSIVGVSLLSASGQPIAQPTTPNIGNIVVCDTLVGKFDGSVIDTLICEPAGPLIKDSLMGEFCQEWTVRTINGSVDNIIIGNTFGIKFIKVGDLDGNGTEEWGFVTEWNSSLTSFELFTAVNSKWKLLTDPIIIWEDHLNTVFTESDIARPSHKRGYIRVKTSVSDSDLGGWTLTDTIVPVILKDYKYELVDW